MDEMFIFFRVFFEQFSPICYVNYKVMEAIIIPNNLPRFNVNRFLIRGLHLCLGANRMEYAAP